jgi:threonine aldolase
MRQAGYLAAAGIYALDHHITRLEEDHHRAQAIGKTLKPLPFVKEVLPIETNIVIFILQDNVKDSDFLQKLKENNIWAVGFGSQTVRMVTHLDFTDEMLDHLNNYLSTFQSSK